MIQHKFGLYEKALPRDLALSEKLRIAKDLGFDYFELSTDESEEFQARVTSDKSEIIEIRKAIEAYDMPIMTMCLSGTRNCPIGSENPELAAKGMKLTMDAIHFSAQIGLSSMRLTISRDDRRSSSGAWRNPGVCRRRWMQDGMFRVMIGMFE